jgi:hypothetical protein
MGCKPRTIRERRVRETKSGKERESSVRADGKKRGRKKGWEREPNERAGQKGERKRGKAASMIRIKRRTPRLEKRKRREMTEKNDNREP